jgi:hypothetical protein
MYRSKAKAGDRTPDAVYITRRRRGAKKVLARPVIVQGYFGDDAIVIGIRNSEFQKNINYFQLG